MMFGETAFECINRGNKDDANSTDDNTAERDVADDDDDDDGKEPDDEDEAARASGTLFAASARSNKSFNNLTRCRCVRA